MRWLIGVLVAVMLVGCGGPNSGPSGGFSGHYTGGGEQGSVTIAFDASSSSITGLNGAALLGCNSGNFTLTPFTVNSTIPLGANGSFSKTQTIQDSSTVTAVLSVQGTLDGSGHASGTVSYILAGVCDSGSHPIQWVASTSSASTSPAASSSSCSPQPCGTDGGVTLAVTGLNGFPPTVDPACDPTQCPPDTLVEMTFTVVNGSNQDLLVSDSLYKLQPGSGQSIDNETISGYGGYLPDGHTCSDNAADLQPGAHSDPLVACFPLTSAQLAEPLKLIWGYGLGAITVGGTIPLSSLIIKPGPTLP